MNNRFANERELSGKNLTCGGNVGFVPGSGADAGAGGLASADAGVEGAEPAVVCDDPGGAPNGRGQR